MGTMTQCQCPEELTYTDCFVFSKPFISLHIWYLVDPRFWLLCPVGRETELWPMDACAGDALPGLVHEMLLKTPLPSGAG